jgi:murein DD-endopeptidase MepM/ murein hydrolase activator NlpD
VIAIVVSAFAGAFVPIPAHAGDLVLPVQNGGAVNSWFDHADSFDCAFPEPGHCTGSLYIYDSNAYQWPASSPWPAYQGGPSQCTLGVSCYRGHSGIDFAANYVPVYAVSDGNVQVANWAPLSGPGNYIRISHPLLGYSSYYGHLSGFEMWVIQGASVAKGQRIGTSGCSGTYCQGAHLHFEIDDSSGRPIDPYGWTGGGDDIYVPNRALGYLWAARYGYSDGSTLSVGEPYLAATGALTEWTGGVTQSAIAGSRIGVLWNGRFCCNHFLL